MSGNTTSLYSTSSSNGTTGSNNFTTLYPSTQGVIVPTTPYGNANVVALLAAGTDGSNTVANITATGNIQGNVFIGNGAGLTNIPGGNIVGGYGNSNVVSLLANFGSNSVSTTGNVTASNVIANNVSTPTVYGQGLAVQGYDFVQMQYSNSVTLPVDHYDIGTGSWFYLDSGGATFQSNTTGTFKQVIIGNDSSISATGNITGGNIFTAGAISATGNITANPSSFFIGNGSQLTGIIAASPAPSIVNGNSSVVVNANGNVTTSVTGVSNVVVVATTGEYVTGVVSATGNITGNYFFGNGSQLTGLPATYGNANVTNLLANLGSNIISGTGNITTTANISGNYILGNGSQLTGIAASYGNANVVSLLANFGSNSISTTGNITGGLFTGNGAGLTSLTGANVTGTVANATYALNSNSASYANHANVSDVANAVSGSNVSGQVANALVAGTVYTAAQPNITSVGTLTSIATSGDITATGNITSTSGVFTGNGAGLTNINAGNIVGAYGNANVVNLLANFGSNTISTTGNVTTGNLTVQSDAVITGNLTVNGNTTTVHSNVVTIDDKFINVANNASTAAQANGGGLGVGPQGSEYATLTYNSTANAWNTNIAISATGNVSGTYITGNGSALSSITGANVTGTVANATYATSAGSANTANTAVTVTGNAQANITSVGTLTSLSVSGNTTAGNLLTGGVVSATGNITGNYFLGNGSQLTGLPATYSNANVATFLANFGSNSISTTGNVTASYLIGNGSLLTSVTGANVTGTVANATYAVSAGSATTAGTVTTNAQPNITSVGILTSVSVSGNITAGNITNNGVSSVTGNVIAGNVLTGGIVSATGNITGNYFIGNGSQLTGITANAAGSNTQIQYNNANAFAGNAAMTFDNTSGNVTLSNLIIGTADATSPTRLNTSNAWSGASSALTTLQPGQMVIGNGYFGNLSPVNSTIASIRGAKALVWDSATVSETTGNGVRYNGLVVMPQVIMGNITNNVSLFRGGVGALAIGGGASANSFTNTNNGMFGVVGFNQSLTVGQPNATIALGNITLQGASASFGQLVTYAGANIANATAVLGQINNAGNITNALGTSVQFTGTAAVTPTNTIGYYMPGATATIGGTNSNSMRAATNYYFLKNDDAVAQTQLGTLRSYNEFRYDTATSGSIAIDKNNAQVQYIAPTANVTITGYNNMVTSLSDSVNTDQEIDTLTVLVQQGATPYTVTLPTGSTYQYAGNISTVPAVANSRSILTVVAANIAGTVNYFTTVQSDQAVASSYGDANVATFLAAFGSNTISTTGTITSGNITGANILTGGIVSATGNITGNYFIGNGSQLTGITATANAAGSNTQIQYNNAGAFAGSANLTFNNTTNTLATTTVTATANINGANLSITGNTIGANVLSYYTGNGTIVNSTVAGNVNATVYPNRIVYGNGYRGDYGANADPINFNRGSQLAVIGTQVVANADLNNASRLFTSSYFLDLNQGANITNTAKRFSGGGFFTQIGNGNLTLTAASGTNLGAVLNSGTQTLVVGNQGNVTMGNASVSHAAAFNSTFLAGTGGTAGNATGALVTVQLGAATSTFTTSQIAYTAQFQGTTGTPAGNVIGYYMPSNATPYGWNSTNLNRAATNYYFLKNDDSVAQNQLGSLRAYHTFQAGGNTTGTWDINKDNGQVQSVSATGNITIGSYTNFVTTANDGTNNDNQTDTVTLIIEQGSTPYTVTMPTGNAAIKYAGNVTTVASTANTTTMISITAYRTSANATGYLTTISPAFQ